MGPAMLLSLFTAVAIADVCRLPFFPPEGPLLSPLSPISYYRHLFPLQYQLWLSLFDVTLVDRHTFVT